MRTTTDGSKYTTTILNKALLVRPTFSYKDRDTRFGTSAITAQAREENIKTGPLMTKMFNDLNRLVKAHNLKSILVCDLWHEGRDMWRRDEFLPDRDILMIWADYGVADFREWPTDLKGYDFGLYIHAGVWLNHVMQDPHPKKSLLLVRRATQEP